jgi:hypothetical protein
VTWLGWFLLAGGVALVVVLAAWLLTAMAGMSDDRDEHMHPSGPLGARLWAKDGQRVVADRLGIGTIIDTSADGGLLLVAWDSGTVIGVRRSEVDPITPEDEALLAGIVAQRPQIVRLGEHVPNDVAARIAAPYCDGLLHCAAHTSTPGCRCCSRCTGEDTR